MAVQYLKTFQFDSTQKQQSSLNVFSLAKFSSILSTSVIIFIIYQTINQVAELWLGYWCQVKMLWIKLFHLNPGLRTGAPRLRQLATNLFKEL